MAHPSTLFATDGGAGGKTGLDLANAAEMDAGAAPNDIWTLFNSDVAAAGGTEILQCADGTVTVTAKGEITRDSTQANPFRMRGRNAANTQDAQVVLDANGGAFPVIQLTTADLWQFFNITAQNTDKNTPNYAWDVGANADLCRWYRCRGDNCYRAWQMASGSTFNRLLFCGGDSNGSHGVSAGNSTDVFIGCIYDNNNGDGLQTAGSAYGCLTSNNASEGFKNVILAVGCVSYSDTLFGFDPGTNSATLVNCLVVDSSGHAVDAAATAHVVTVNLAHYNNTSGLFNGTNFKAVNTIALSADPFVDAASRDFRLNKAAGGGDLVRGIAHAAIDGNWTGYPDGGAVQSQPVPLRNPGTSGGATG